MVAACTRFVEVEEIGLAVYDSSKETTEMVAATEKWHIPGVFKIGVSCPKLTRLVLPAGTVFKINYIREVLIVRYALFYFISKYRRSTFVHWRC